MTLGIQPGQRLKVRKRLKLLNYGIYEVGRDKTNSKMNNKCTQRPTSLVDSMKMFTWIETIQHLDMPIKQYQSS